MGNMKEVLEALRRMVQLWDDNNPDDKCACMGASPDCPNPGPCELCFARQAIADADVTPSCSSNVLALLRAGKTIEAIKVHREEKHLGLYDAKKEIDAIRYS